MRYEHGSRNLGFRFYLLRNGVEYKPLPSIGEPTIRMDSRAEIKKGLSGEFLLPEDADILNDRIRAILVINGAEYPLGEYVATTKAEQTAETGRKSAAIEAYDGCYLVKRFRTEGRICLKAGRAYTDVAQELIQQSGVAKVLIDPSPLTLAADREDWELGTSHLDIVNQLLGEINYSSLWFDNDGFARAGKAPPAKVTNIKHTYLPGQYSVVSRERTTETDVFDKYNVFMAIVDNADLDAPMVATAVNDNPGSILSIYHRGRIQAPVERLDNIASQAELQAYVDAWRDASMMSTITEKIRTALMPGHEVGDIVAIEGGICREAAWEMTLGIGGQMTHTLEREVFV